MKSKHTHSIDLEAIKEQELGIEVELKYFDEDLDEDEDDEFDQNDDEDGEEDFDDLNDVEVCDPLE